MTIVTTTHRVDIGVAPTITSRPGRPDLIERPCLSCHQLVTTWPADEATEDGTCTPADKPRPRLTITHSSAEGTLLGGTTKGDGAWEAIKAAQTAYKIRGWKYFPSIRAIGVSHSRDRAPQLHLIDRTAEILRAAGFDVDVEIDGTPRALEDAEADRAERMEDRAEALTAKAARKGAEAEARWKAGEQIAERNSGGQPVLVGHHSERGHRRDLKRMDGHMRAAVQLTKEAETAAERAATAERHMEARTNPRRVYRRIRTQEAELRKVQRALAPCRISGAKLKADGAGRTLHCPACYTEVPGVDMLFPEHGAPTGRSKEQLELKAAHLAEQLRGWREALAKAKAEGVWVPVDPADVKKGHWIKSWAGWTKVVRANKVSITVEDRYRGGSTFHRKITIDEIREHRETAPWEDQAATVDLDELDAADAAKAATPPAEAPAPTPRADTRGGLSPEVLDVLRLAAADEQTVRLNVRAYRLRPEQLAEIEQVMVRLGGRWDRQQLAYRFDRRDPRPALEELTGTRPLPPPSPARDLALSYWPTPPALAAEVADVARELRRNARVLEPSAGDGALVAAIREANPEVHVTAVEVDSYRAAQLQREHGGEMCRVLATSFEEFAAAEEYAFDAVVMNPPFTLPDDRQAWVTHLELAWGLLAPGGELRAIVPASLESGQQRRIAAVRELIVAAGGSWRPAGEGAFKASGTGVNALVVEATR